MLSAVRPAAASASRTVVQQAHQQANMATLKEIQMRLKSITNIGKITKSMKMIASTKMARAQRGMDVARANGAATSALVKNIGVQATTDNPNVFVAVSSDRGLCGGVHSAITKNIKRTIKASNTGDAALVILGDKCRNQLAREYREAIKLTYSQLGKTVPSFLEASIIADEILAIKDLPANPKINVVYNKFLSVIAYEPTHMHTISYADLKAAPKLATYEMEGDILANLHQFMFATSLHWAMNEGHAAEFAARRSAMDNATKNAGEMVDRLTLLYNRQRQASITNDLVDIITGASAL
ncbi:ATP synthase F1, gamma subunit [Catenaria anguillulae PL171]|uniref:ATP synthase subunit gamma n=1 Tax=Catenaria anguillulae PL171 TaxID=765915 RepID=A0A1Y2HXF1_9FUNG|nr:ATP synthase F1, gamma subunit [Catenaria anguillulae PL171]